MSTWGRMLPFVLLTGLLFHLGTPAPLHAVAAESELGAELPIQTGGIRFLGEASPGALVTFERNGAVIGTQAALSDSSFDATFTTEPLGSATYSIKATDLHSRDTAEISSIATILPAFTTTLSGYLLPTTFSVSFNPIKRPRAQVIDGTARHNSVVTTLWSGSKYSDTFTTQATTGANGDWTGSSNQTLHLGTYTTSAVVQAPGGALSPQTPDASFQVVLSADLNNDTKVNLTDFSILMFFYLQTNINKPADINDDTKTNLTDFSIMLFFWTG